ncbi:MAG: DUF488 domain-containing protein [Bacteroidetes bacterium]|nr:DUF488 domain-containing protein [Bacteroidota bacterium]
MKTIAIKRIYENASESDGYRILVDRLWPRGISKQRAELDEWNKDIAPSTGLRKWFGHKAERFDEFAKLYTEELITKKDDLNKIRIMMKKKPVTLLYSAKDPQLNQAIILRNILIKITVCILTHQHQKLLND